MRIHYIQTVIHKLNPMTRDIVDRLDEFLAANPEVGEEASSLISAARTEIIVQREHVAAHQKLRASLLMQNLVEAFDAEPWMLEYFLAEPELKGKLFELGETISRCRAGS